ncbi:hypothetical protein [Agromyces albus]|uniref:hypothetical protein n=1 Tax=Agromyces albus TaxID=205332 RepID=UPI002784A105|nr:hypothetical protein [Agromyces albus]MDQ0577770.1 hypothetical protein [Agromyces albus]
MSGDRAGLVPATSKLGGFVRQRAAAPGIADCGGHGRPEVVLERRFRSFVRRVYVLLIAIAVSIVLFRIFAPQRGMLLHGTPLTADVLWLLPAAAGGAAAGAAIVVASASRAALEGMARVGLPGLGAGARALSNGLTWAAIALLGVHFTANAFAVLPGGHSLVGAILGGSLGFGTYRLHRHAIEHDAYRTFNLVAMLLATGILASMSMTPTGEWWTLNFSTLGTSDDVAAACFNVAIIVSGAGMAGLARSLTRALTGGRFSTRRGGLRTMKALIIIIGVCLIGLGFVPIDGAMALHNAFAAAAAGAFALLCLGVQVWARQMPRLLVLFSYVAFSLEVVAMIAYDRLGFFSLTVFEIVAFTLVFVWLIALVATTAMHPQSQSAEALPDASVRRHLAVDSFARRATTAAAGPVSHTPDRRAPRSIRSSTGVMNARVRRRSRRTGSLSHEQRSMWRAGVSSDDPPDHGISGRPPR